ncbi:20S proteasome subunit [Flammula alnicola]|nr:20S proteasome subunit [Flammula alnicola]
MATSSVYNFPGFDFTNELRNNFLTNKGLPLPKATSTGTTIVACLFKDGIVLGADTRAMEGPIVADKNCEKDTESIRCCGAGTAADTEFTTALISSNMELHALQTGRKPRVVTAMTMLKQILFRFLVGLILLVNTGIIIHPHGSTDKLPYVTMGSGSLAAMAVFETGWKPNMEREDALKLVKAAVAAGIFNDLGSGSNIDVCIITASHTEMLRNVEMPNQRVQKERDYKFRRGTTAWKKEDIRKFVVDEQLTLIGGDELDTS